MKRKILVVDDDKAIHAFLRAIPQKDYDVISAVDGLQGVTLAKQGKPDLVLLDLQMPAGGGFFGLRAPGYDDRPSLTRSSC